MACLHCSENAVFAHIPLDVSPTCFSRVAAETAASQPLVHALLCKMQPCNNNNFKRQVIKLLNNKTKT